MVESERPAACGALAIVEGPGIMYVGARAGVGAGAGAAIAATTGRFAHALSMSRSTRLDVVTGPAAVVEGALFEERKQRFLVLRTIRAKRTRAAASS